MTVTREQVYINEARTSARKVWEGINELKTLQAEWNAKDYGNTLDDGDQALGHGGITKDQVGAAVFATADALLVTLSSGHATNLARLL